LQKKVVVNVDAVMQIEPHSPEMGETKKMCNRCQRVAWGLLDFWNMGGYADMFKGLLCFALG
jgi:hypothetical protein